MKRYIKYILIAFVAICLPFLGYKIITKENTQKHYLAANTATTLDNINVTYKSEENTEFSLSTKVDRNNKSLLLVDYGMEGTSTWTHTNITGTYTNSEGTIEEATYEAYFAGWKLVSINNEPITNEYIYPDNDYIYFNDEPFSSYESTITDIELEAVWGKVIYVRDKYNFHDITNVYGYNVENSTGDILTAKINWDTSKEFSSNTNNGATIDTPVETIDQAYKLLTDSYGGKIAIVNHITLEAPLTGGYQSYASDFTNVSKSYVFEWGNNTKIPGVVTITGLNLGSGTSVENKINGNSTYTDSYIYIKNTRGAGTYNGKTYGNITLQIRPHTNTILEGLSIISYRENYNSISARQTADTTIYNTANSRLVIENTVKGYKRSTSQSFLGLDAGNLSHATIKGLVNGKSQNFSALSSGLSGATHIYAAYGSYTHNGSTYKLKETDNLYLTLRGGTSWYSVRGVYAVSGGSKINNLHMYIEGINASNIYGEYGNSLTANIMHFNLFNATASSLSPTYNGELTANEINTIIDSTSSKKTTTLYTGGYNTSSNGVMYKINATTNTKILGNAQVTNFYGGGNQVATILTGEVNLDIESGTITNIYGGGLGGFVGNEENPTNVNINVSGGKINYIYGGGSGGFVALYTSASPLDASTYSKEGKYFYTSSNKFYTTDRATYSPTATRYDESTVELRNYAVKSGNTILSTYNSVYGEHVYPTSSDTAYSSYYRNTGEYTISDALLTGDVTINLNNGTNVVYDVYGGGKNGAVTGNININVEKGAKIGGSIYGGGEGLNSEITGTFNEVNYKWTNSNEDKVLNIDKFIELANKENTIFKNAPTTGNYTRPFLTKVELLASAKQNDGYVYIYSSTISKLGLIKGNTNITVNGGTITKNIYGGSNGSVASVSGDTNITFNDGTVTEIYGGGNAGIVDGTTLNITGGKVNGNVYGGGNEANINDNTNIILNNAVINGNLYAGGNNGEIKSSSLKITSSYIKNNVFGGGNAADIKGNSSITIEGDTTIEGNVFGGGNEGHVGEEDKNTSSTEINIVGGTINGNVYGGGNTSKVFGKTNINIGSNAVSDTSLTPHNIKINGTIFGGGEANASGSDEYDFSYIAVTDGVEINIDAKDYDTFDITGSIFGSGNASTSEGTSIINISNYGTNEAIKKNISIQRASIVTIDNSNIDLSGTTDRTNEFSNEIFTISRVDEFIIKNDSYLYLENGTNLLKKWTSKNNDSLTTKDNMNHLYIAPGKNMKVTTSQDATSYGVVEGITYLGIYDPTTYDKGIYDEDTKTTTTFTNGIYVLGAHSNDPETNGFVSSFEEDTIIDDYVTPVPEGQSYHIWKVGGEVYLESISLTASKYEVLGGYANVVFPLSSSDTSYSITDVDITGLVSGVNIINPSDIKDVYENNEDALNNIGVVMRTSSGWAEENSFVLLSENNGSFIGEESFLTESSDRKPNMEFYIYNAKNITENKDLGYFKVTLEAIKQVSALEREFKTVIITINLDTAYYEDFHYEGQIAPGAKFEKFGSAATNINTESSFSTYFESNTFSSSNPYQGNYERVVISSFPFKANTTIKMIDIVNNKFYYYNVTTSDEESGKTEYLLKDFYEMGSTTKKYNDKTNYYDSNTKLIKEEFIFTVSFENTTGQTESLNNTFFLNLREQSRAISITPNDSALSNMNYNLLIGDNSYTLSNTITSSTIREDEELDFILNVEVKPANSNLIDIEDTKNQFKKQGLKLTFYQNGVKLSPEKLLGVALVIDDKEYYVNSNGEIAVVLQNKINSITKSMSIKGLDVGTYTVKEEYAISSSGLYFSDSLATYETEITVNKNNFGIKVNIPDEELVILKENNTNMTFDINYESDLDNPNIRMSMYKKYQKDAYNFDYLELPVNDYTGNNLQEKTETEVVISNNPSNQTLSLKPTALMTEGTYKFVFKLYDNNKLVGEYIVYKIIK